MPALNGHDEDAVNLLHRNGDDWGFYNDGNRWTFGVYMYKAAQQFGMKFRIAWHWNAVRGRSLLRAGLPRGRLRLVHGHPRRPADEHHLLRAAPRGLGDYRRLLTLQKLIQAKPNTPAAKAGKKVLEATLATFKLGETQATEKTLPGGYPALRTRLDNAIEALRK